MEIWKDIEGYEGYYQVSNLGRVKSLERYVTHNYGGQKIVPEKILKGYMDNRNYNAIRVTLSKENKQKRFTLSRLVAKHFIPNPNKLPLVEHIDDDPTNNNVINLKWGTHKSNAEARELRPENHQYRKERLDRLQTHQLS